MDRMRPTPRKAPLVLFSSCSSCPSCRTTEQKILSIAFLLSLLCVLSPAHAQIAVSPTGVNVASQGATTVFLTFGGLSADQVPAEAFWCGELIDARPDVGLRCDPSTLFGQLPLRFDLARTSGTGALTDVMTIPPSVARRAWQAAQAGRPAAFFYVRRFVDRRGGPDVFVAVTCRLTAGGAGVPLALTDVRLAFDSDAPVVAVAGGPDGSAPPLFADVLYTGTGRLQGRWEVVRPGDDPPSESDLLPEASLPLEQRGTQRRWAPLARFDVFLPPNGRVRVPGPDPASLPRDADGTYLVLFRVEASADPDARSDLAAVRAGSGVVTSGAVAGFALPTLRYVVGSGAVAASDAGGRALLLLQPALGAAAQAGTLPAFAWTPVPLARRYRLEVERADGTAVFEALVAGDVAAYRAPPVLVERAGTGALRWRVRAEDALGREVARSGWRALTLTTPESH